MSKRRRLWPLMRMRRDLCRLVPWCLPVAGLLALAGPASARPEQGEWQVYTSTGIESRAYTAPTTVEVGLPEEVEVPSQVTGTGQGTRLTDVAVEVREGMGGHPTAGPADDQAMCLAEDSAGNIWVGTSGGLSRFDGTGWTTFTQEDGLAGDVVGFVAFGTDGTLWTAGPEGITQFDGRAWTRYAVVAGAIAIGPNGDLWVAGANQALFRFDGHDWWRYGPEDGLPAPGTTMWLAIDHDGAVWASVEGGEVPPFRRPELTCFDGRQWTSYNLDPDGNAPVTAIYVDSHNRLWVSTGTCLLLFDGKTWRRYPGPRFSVVYAIAEDDLGRYWMIGATEELGYLSGGRWTSVRGTASSLFSTAMLFDSHGDLWAALLQGGLVRSSRAQLPTAVGQMPDASVPAVCQLSPAFPNPFNSETQIRFSLPRSDRISLRVLGASGQAVATLAQGDYGPGAHQLSWDGRDAMGRSVASGVYLCELAGSVHLVRKLALVR